MTRIQRYPLDLFIDQVTQSVERAELAVGVVHERDRELLRTIAGCECPYCESNPPEPCQEDAQVLAETEDGWKVLCGMCVEDCLAGHGRELGGMTDEELREWGLVR